MTSPVGAARQPVTRAPSTSSYRGIDRPLSPETAQFIPWLGSVCIGTGGVAALVAYALGRKEAVHPALLLAVGAAATVVGVGFAVLVARQATFINRHLGALIYVFLLVPPLMISAGQYAVGPRLQIAVLLYVEVPIFGYFLLSRLRALALIAYVAAAFGLVLTVQPGYTLPVVAWLFVTGSLCVVSYVFGSLLTRAVEESERSSRLGRFLAPQVAEAVLSSPDQTALEPHRRQIAVLFCDLRGFTRFSALSEPEDIVEVLQAYMRTAGSLVHEMGATVGAFAGDGIMAYFNDPVPCEDPCGAATELALRLRGPLDQLVRTWRTQGFELGYGIGVAYGFATLGVFGFEGRNDYTALGSVVNLAARLSDAASPGEILIDQRTHDAVGAPSHAVRRQLDLKGIPGVVAAFSLPD